MRNGIAEMDHLMTAVADPDAAGRDYERLGFTLTPLSVIHEMGLSNRLILFDPLTPDSGNFIELMAVHDAARANPQMRAFLAGPAGTRSMVMASPDADAARAELDRNGYAPGPVHRLARVWELPSGERLDVSFDVLLPIAAPFTFNLCRHRTLQHYLRQEWRQHANGARSLVAVYGVASDPKAAIGYFEALFGRPARQTALGALAVAAAAVELQIFSPDQFADAFGLARTEGYAGFAIRVGDLAATRRLLGAAATERAGGLVAGPLHGNVIHFVA